MPVSRAGRCIYACFIVLMLLFIGRNLYQRHVNARLVDAVLNQDTASIRLFLRRGADPNSVYSPYKNHHFDAPVLTVAAYHCPPEAVTLLLEAGATVDCRAYAKETPLMQAVNQGAVQNAQALLAWGADATATDAYRYSVIDRAADYRIVRRGDGRGARRERWETRRLLVKMLQEKGARLTLTQAARIDDIDALRTALESNADVHIRDSDERSPLEIAAQNGSQAAVDLLLAHGADVNQGSQAGSPLVAAIDGNNEAVAHALLKHGATVNPKTDVGYTPLTAAIYSMPALVDELLQRGANINARQGQALRAAIERRQSEAVVKLLQRGADVNACDYGASFSRGASPLMSALIYAPEVVPMLLQRGADVHIMDRGRQTALHIALANNRFEFVAPFIAAGIDVNSRDFRERTPLNEAVEHCPRGVPLLLEHGADPNVFQQSGLPLLPTAVLANNPQVIRLLLAHGAHPNLRGRHGHTALYYARRHHREEISRLLEQAGGKEE